MNRTPFLFLLAVVSICALPNAFASAASVSVQNIAPGTSVVAKSQITFGLSASGFVAPTYRLTDSFSGSSVSSNNINPGGSFAWVPAATDAGTHMLTISVSDYNGNAASVSQTITVLPPPSITVGTLSPGDSVMPGTLLRFSVTPAGFTNPRYSISDDSSNTTLVASAIDTNGVVLWKPEISDIGDHTITIYAYDSMGHSAETRVRVRVGSGPQLFVGQINPGTNIKPGQMLSFLVNGVSFSPTGFGVYDPFRGTTLSGSNINTTGQFYWTPSPADIGTHTLQLTGTVGLSGASASTTLAITVLGTDGTASAAPASTASTTSLANLQAKLAALQSAMTTTAPSSAPGHVFVSYLRPGSNGNEVLRLQNILAKLGYLAATPNGNYGPATIEAVIKFQQAKGLAQLGVVGPATRAALNGLDTSVATPAATQTANVVDTSYVFEHFMGVGDDDDDVVHLQQRLIALGYLQGTATGTYGPLTEAAVKKYQKAKGLTQTGYVERVTRAALNAR
jgi:peptidoglycan hydrolase-like protein with peptidoglycan-binding domain